MTELRETNCISNTSIKVFGIWKFRMNYMIFSIFVDVEYLDYSNLLAENNAKFSDVAKMFDVIPPE